MSDTSFDTSTGIPDYHFYQSKRAFTILILLGSLSLLTRLIIISHINSPAHGDPAYYFSLAKNLADGRGFVIDYVWHFLNSPGPLTHYSNDFWLPLTSVISCIFMLLFGKSVFAALLPSLILGIIAAVVTYFIAREYTNSRMVAFWSAVIVLHAPGIFLYSLMTESAIYYVVLSSLALLMIIKAHRNPRYYFLAAILIGIDQLGRQDSVLIMVVLVITIILSRTSMKMKLGILGISVAVYLATISPLFILNIIYTGQVNVSHSYEVAFMKSHEEIYSFGNDISFKSYLDWGFKNILLSKIDVIPINMIQILKAFGREMIIIPIVSFTAMLFPVTLRLLRRFQPFIIFAIVLVTFYTVLGTAPAYGGSLLRCAMVFVPFTVVIAVSAIIRVIKSRTIILIVLIGIASMATYGSIRLSQQLVGITEKSDRELKQVAATLANLHASEDEIVVMTRNPWEFHSSTNLRAVQIPSNDLDTIYKVAINYNANYLLLPAPREATLKIYSGDLIDQRFKLIAVIDHTDYKLFRIDRPVGDIALIK